MVLTLCHEVFGSHVMFLHKQLWGTSSLSHKHTLESTQKQESTQCTLTTSIYLYGWGALCESVTRWKCVHGWSVAPGTAGTVGRVPASRVLCGSARLALAPQLSAHAADDAKVWGERADNEGTHLVFTTDCLLWAFRGGGELHATPRPLLP